MSFTKELRPGRATEANESSTEQGAGSAPILPLATDSALIDRAEAIVVLVQDKAGRYRRRVFLTLASAERAVDQAAARGVDAQVVLCRLTPVEGGEVL